MRTPAPRQTAGSPGKEHSSQGLFPHPLSFVQGGCCWPPGKLFLHSSYFQCSDKGWEGTAEVFILKREMQKKELNLEMRESFDSPVVALTMSLLSAGKRWMQE